MNVNLSGYSVCFRCGGNDLVLDYKAGDIICSSCGEVISDHVIDEGNETKFYMNDDDPHKTSRTSGLSETIGSLHTSFVTNSESVKRTLERAQKFSSDKKELQALAHMNIVSEMCCKMNLIGSIKNRAVDIFTKSILARAVISKSKDPIAAACVYLACRMENYPRTLDEVSFGTGIDVRQVNKLQQAIARRLQLNVGRLRPYHLVNRFAAKVMCAHEVGALALTICQALTRLELLETQAPQVLAVGSIVVACLLEGAAVDLAELAVASLVPAPQIRAVYRSMHPLLAAVVPAGHQTRCGEDRAQALARLPLSLDKAGDKLPAREMSSPFSQGRSSVGTAKGTPPGTDAAKMSAGAAVSVDVPTALEEPDSALSDLVGQLVQPIARVSANNLTALLQEKGASRDGLDRLDAPPAVSPVSAKVGQTDEQVANSEIPVSGKHALKREFSECASPSGANPCDAGEQNEEEGYGPNKLRKIVTTLA